MLLNIYRYILRICWHAAGVCVLQRWIGHESLDVSLWFEKSLNLITLERLWYINKNKMVDFLLTWQLILFSIEDELQTGLQKYMNISILLLIIVLLLVLLLLLYIIIYTCYPVRIQCHRRTNYAQIWTDKLCVSSFVWVHFISSK